jgi:hypothetical protein
MYRFFVLKCVCGTNSRCAQQPPTPVPPTPIPGAPTPMPSPPFVFNFFLPIIFVKTIVFNLMFVRTPVPPTPQPTTVIDALCLDIGFKVYVCMLVVAIDVGTDAYATNTQPADTCASHACSSNSSSNHISLPISLSLSLSLSLSHIITTEQT